MIWGLKVLLTRIVHTRFGSPQVPRQRELQAGAQQICLFRVIWSIELVAKKASGNQVFEVSGVGRDEVWLMLIIESVLLH